ncbi:DUF1656 domain-containing protein [Sulfurimonas paralvinellae]|uniref:DUF1656 domain-containing protein n=1 Tax=Sulfurimonas paralvinellae TaxID=317658 RepID=A0A7M1B7E4_9BACT|nr:DUF1656 domain-containing protein [Sulfurimonas paralvinellae]QOP45624.1 DUF1656 domain-containing protein [Sulfurimonas paralvinellae]
MNSNVPHEIIISGVYFSPLLIVFFLAFIAALITAVIFNKLKISQFIVHIPLGFLSLLTLYIVLIDAYFIKI